MKCAIFLSNQVKLLLLKTKFLVIHAHSIEQVKDQELYQQLDIPLIILWKFFCRFIENKTKKLG